MTFVLETDTRNMGRDCLTAVFLLLSVVCGAFSARLKYEPHRAPNDPQQKWGYVDVRPDAHMFYWLYLTTNPAGFSSRPLVMWLQGGPGGSGTGFGNFEEIGPLDVDLKPRNTTWLQEASLLFVDNPVGTGFSYVDNKQAYTTNVEQIAEDMLVLLKAFFKNTTQLQAVPFYIFSESYGGKMTAAISQSLYMAIKSGGITCNFKGLAMGDSWIDPEQSTINWGPYLYVNSLVDLTGYLAIKKETDRVQALIKAGRWAESTAAWGSAQSAVEAASNGVNFYNILKWGAEEPSTIVSFKDSLAKLWLTKLHQDKLAALMNGPIKEKLGIPENVVWGGQSEMVFATQSGDFMKPVTSTVNHIIEDFDLKVVVYSGQLDLIVETLGTEAWVYNLTMAEDFKNAKHEAILHPITKLTSAFVKNYKNFSFYWILDAGHMIPQDQGEVALKMLQMVLND